jgi:uncharacterized protein (TIRG00374 family)
MNEFYYIVYNTNTLYKIWDREYKLKILDKKLIGLVISVIFIAIIFHQLDIKKTCESFKQINLMYLLLAVPLYYISFLFRALRWRSLLSNNDLTLKSLLSALFMGYTANNLLPARMGEIYRAYMFGKKEGLKRSTVFASILLERIFDGVIIFFILITLISHIYSKPWLFHVAFGAGSIFVTGFIMLFIFAKLGNSDRLQDKSSLMYEKFRNNILIKFPEGFRNKLIGIINKLVYFINSFVDGLGVFHNKKASAYSLFLTLLIWLCEGFTTFLVIQSFGIKIGIIAGLFVVCLTTFSTLIPAGPANIGTYQFGYIMALKLFDVNKETAFAVSIINQFVTIILPAIACFFIIWRNHINIKELEEEFEESTLLT